MPVHIAIYNYYLPITQKKLKTNLCHQQERRKIIFIDMLK